MKTLSNQRHACEYNPAIRETKSHLPYNLYITEFNNEARTAEIWHINYILHDMKTHVLFKNMCKLAINAFTHNSKVSLFDLQHNDRGCCFYPACILTKHKNLQQNHIQCNCDYAPPNSASSFIL